MGTRVAKASDHSHSEGMTTWMEDLGSLRAAGRPLRTDNATEADPEGARLPGHWARFHAGPRPAGPVVGIYGAYAGDHRAPYTLWAAVIEAEGPLPEGFEALDLPSRRARIFEREGAFPAVVAEVWAEVWAHFEASPDPARAYTWDVERITPGPDGRATVRLEISLR